MKYLYLLLLLYLFQNSNSQLDFFLKARAFDIQGNADSALLYYSKVLEKRPNEKIYIYIGNLYYKNGIYTKAIDNYLNADRLKNNISSFNLALCYGKLHDTAKTILYLRKNLSSENKVSASEIQMEPAFSFLKNTNEWKNVWQNDWYSKYDQQIGELNYIFSSGDWTGVINYVSDYSIRGDAIRHKMLYMRGKAFFETGNYDAALNDFNNAINTNKREYIYYEARADLEVIMKNFKSAEIDYNLAINLNSDVFSLYKKRGYCRIELSKFDKAIEDAMLLTTLFPSDIEYIQLLGIANYKSAKYIKALESFNIVISKQSNNMESYLYRARIYLKTGMVTNAMNDYNLILDKDPNNIIALRERGQLKLDNNNSKGACSDWFKAEKLGDIEAGNLRWQNCK